MISGRIHTGGGDVSNTSHVPQQPVNFNPSSQIGQPSHMPDAAHTPSNPIAENAHLAGTFKGERSNSDPFLSPAKNRDTFSPSGADDAIAFTRSGEDDATNFAFRKDEPQESTLAFEKDGNDSRSKGTFVSEDVDGSQTALRGDTSKEQDSDTSQEAVFPVAYHEEGSLVIVEAIKSGDGALGREVHEHMKSEIVKLADGQPIAPKRTILDNLIKRIATMNFFNSNPPNPADVLKNNNGYIARGKQLEEEHANTKSIQSNRLVADPAGFFKPLTFR